MTKQPSYQELNDELEAILSRLQDGELTIDEALPAYERGMTVVKQLETLLKATELKIERLQPELSE